MLYAPAIRAALGTRAQYPVAQHVKVVCKLRRALDLDQWLAGKGVMRSVVVPVPGFAGVAPFVKGTDWLTTAPSLLGLR